MTPEFSGNYHVLMWAAYALFIAGSLHALFGIVRTATLRLPVLQNDHRTTWHLFPLDYSPRLRHGDGRVRVWWKLLVLLASFAAWHALAGLLIKVTESDGYYPMGWTVLSQRQAYSLHYWGFAAACAVVVVFALRNRHTFGASRDNPIVKTPFDRLNVFYLREWWIKGRKQLFLYPADEHEQGKILYMRLFTGAKVDKFADGETHWFVVPVRDGVRVDATTSHPEDVLAEIEAFLVRNRL